jgi:hypothetical protein
MRLMPTGGRCLHTLQAVALAAVCGATALAQRPAPSIARFFEATDPDDGKAARALEDIAGNWRPGYAAIFVDLLRLIAPSPEPSGAGSRVRRRLVQFLELRTGQRFGDDLNAWRRWTWRLPYDPHPQYATAKSEIAAHVDPRMRRFFPEGVRTAIRLDEVDWGGVRVNGIPPLDHPRVQPASQASYLSGANVVFGVVVNGEARAYPKRILAWHELARDTVGGTPITVVYCTLCGTVIPYESMMGGKLRVLGTSGLLYRSNKLMFDEETMSLWSTMEGKPVVGPLVGSGIELVPLPVVTTTWREWRARHPQTTVLAEDTGHARDYSEGAAYRGYFGTDELMFDVPHPDARLKNKAEVLAVLLTGRNGVSLPVAISADFLKRHRLFQRRFGDHSIVITTSEDGANRVYEAGSVRFVRLIDDTTLRDSDGREWVADEEKLALRGPGSRSFRRVAARRAFWFGWHAQFPRTELVR